MESTNDPSWGPTANVIEGSPNNNISAGLYGTTISGGGNLGHPNSVTAIYGTVGGGEGNSAWNTATVSGGEDNTAGGQYSTVGGGIGNSAALSAATVAGGQLNTANGVASSVSGGANNEASGPWSTVLGGRYNTASGWYSTASGYTNTAGGTYSFAAGQQAQAMHQGTFVWADSQNAPFASTANDQFLIRAQGGLGMNTATTIGNDLCLNNNTYLFSHAIFLRGDTGVDHNHALAYNGNTVTNFGTGQYQVDGPALWGFAGGLLGTRGGGDHAALVWSASGVTVNGTFNNNSDRNAKQDIDAVKPSDILQKVTQLPVAEWSYKVDASTRHIGPMAQDFYSVFDIGTDDKHIAPIDEGGVALAAIQGLNEKVENGNRQAQNQIEELKAENTRLKEQMDELKALVLRLTNEAKEVPPRHLPNN